MARLDPIFDLLSQDGVKRLEGAQCGIACPVPTKGCNEAESVRLHGGFCSARSLVSHQRPMATVGVDLNAYISSAFFKEMQSSRGQMIMSPW